MTSPFSTFEEFSSAEGAIYTFADKPAVIAVLLILSLLITIYFFYASFGMKQELGKSPDVKAIGLLLVAGFASVMGALSQPQADRREAAHPRHSQEMRAEKNWQPLAFLGLMGLGGTAMGQKAKRRSRKTRRVR
jgi:hypothetical protein